MTIRQMIERLNAIATDPNSGLTFESRVFIEGLETEPSEEAQGVHPSSPYGDLVAMISAISDEEMAALDAAIAARKHS